MGAPPNEDQIAAMLEDPAMIQQMQRTLENPAVIEQIMNMNPMFRDNPQMREMLTNPAMRQMITNPEFIRASAAMRRAQAGAANPAFPAPGATDNTPAGAPATGGAAAGANNNNGQAPPLNPFGFGAFGGGAGAGAGAGNPFAALLNPAAGAGAPGAAGAGGAANNPFGFTPEMMQQAEQMMRNMGMGGGAGGFGGFPDFGGAAAPAAPADTRPPEERYADQLQQLNEMGFYDFDQNVSALRRSGGNVQGAVNFLLGG